MTTEIRFSPNAQINLLTFETALSTLRDDLRRPGPCLAYAYLIDPPWFIDLFQEHLANSLLMVLADNRQRSELRTLVSHNPKLKAATWSSNRTMHDKTLIFPIDGITYLTTTNLTKGAWTLSLNNVARITCPSLCSKLAEQFHQHWTTARPVVGLQRP